MKRLTTLMLLSLVAIGMLSCNKEDDPEPIEFSAEDLYGEWEVSSFTMNGQNRTAELSEYTFEIFFNGDFLVNRGTNDSFGSYEVDEEAGTFTIDLSNPKEPSSVIEGTWELYGKSETTLWLKSFGQDSEKEFRLTKI